MNKYYLTVEFNNGRGVEKWGPYDTREEAVSVKQSIEYFPWVEDIRLGSEPS